MRGSFGAAEDAACRIFTGGFAAVTGGGDGVDIGALRGKRGIHIRHFALHQFECANRLTELFALMDVWDNNIHTSLHNTEWAT